MVSPSDTKPQLQLLVERSWSESAGGAFQPLADTRLTPDASEPKKTPRRARPLRLCVTP
jgi:hypothetical protein